MHPLPPKQGLYFKCPIDKIKTRKRKWASFQKRLQTYCEENPGEATKFKNNRKETFSQQTANFHEEFQYDEEEVSDEDDDEEEVSDEDDGEEEESDEDDEEDEQMNNEEDEQENDEVKSTKTRKTKKETNPLAGIRTTGDVQLLLVTIEKPQKQTRFLSSFFAANTKGAPHEQVAVLNQFIKASSMCMANQKHAKELARHYAKESNISVVRCTTIEVWSECFPQEVEFNSLEQWNKGRTQKSG
jgi:hypothetical protein